MSKPVPPTEFLAKMNRLQNPISAFHLENLLYRYKFVMKFQNQHVLNNYEFWNARGLRQYLLYITDYSYKTNNETVFKEITVPYLTTITKMVKKFDLLEELQGIIISQTFDSDVKKQRIINSSVDIKM